MVVSLNPKSKFTYFALSGRSLVSVAAARRTSGKSSFETSGLNQERWFSVTLDYSPVQALAVKQNDFELTERRIIK
jgi:hypothetical protein